MKLYHLTPFENRDSIIRDGLLPMVGPSRDPKAVPAVFLATRADFAFEIAFELREKHDKLAIFAVDVSSEDVQPDPETDDPTPGPPVSFYCLKPIRNVEYAGFYMNINGNWTLTPVGMPLISLSQKHY